MSNNRDIQRKDQAGHTKLTTVSVWLRGGYRTFFVMLQHNEHGQAVLPLNVQNQLLLRAGRREQERCGFM